MSTERERILRMIQEGIISKEEGDELLAALGGDVDGEPEAIPKGEAEPPIGPPPRQAPHVTQKKSPAHSTGVMVAGFVLLFLCFARFLEHSAFIVFSRPWIFGIKPLHLTSGCFVGGWSPLGTFSTLFTLLILIGAVGVLFFKEWARKFLVIMLALHAFFSFFGILMMRGISIFRFNMDILGLVSSASVLGWIMVDVFFIWYFSRTSIRPQFS
jgi:hypothetical protein